MVLHPIRDKTASIWIACTLFLVLLGLVLLAGCGGEAATAAKEESRRTANVKPASLPPLQIRQTLSGDEVISLPSDLYFAFDSAALSRAARSQLQNEVLPRVREFLSSAGNLVVLRGFTDGAGDTSYNAQLSERRAAAVRRFLVAAGVSPGQLSAHGFGEQLATSSDPDQSLRRVDVVFQKGGSR